MSFLYHFVVSVLRKMNIYNKRNLNYSSVISSLINDGKKETILDIGTGTGQIANTLCKKEKGFIVGSDIDRRVFKHNRPRLFHSIVADAHHMPFKNEAFDTTLFISCIEHLDHPSTAIGEISRITKQNGICITQLPNLQWIMEPHTKFPFLYLMPYKLSSIIKKSSGYNSLNLNVTLSKVLSWFTHSDFVNTHRKPIYHNLQIFKLLPWPPGWFLVFHKTYRKECAL